MTKRTWGIVAGLIGAGAGAWWWNARRSAANRNLTPAREHGTVIFDNTPTAADESII